MDTPLAMLAPEQPVLHAGRRATCLHMRVGVAIIRHWGDSHAVAVPPETLSLVPSRRRVPLAPQDEPLARESS
jgi:hypothetical protein